MPPTPPPAASQFSRNRLLFITGANRGLGAAAVDSSLRQGWKVAGCARKLEALDEMEARWGTENFIALRCDVTRRDTIEQALAECCDRFGHPNVVVANAGIGEGGRFQDLTASEIDAIVQTNLLGVMHTAHAALPLLRSAGSGQIITVASVSAEVPTTLAVVYAATKAGVAAFTEALRRELGGTGIEAGTILPGFIRTRMTRGVPLPMPEPELFGRALVSMVRRPRRRMYVPRYYAPAGWINRLAPGPMDLITSFVMRRLHERMEKLNSDVSDSQSPAAPL